MKQQANHIAGGLCFGTIFLIKQCKTYSFGLHAMIPTQFETSGSLFELSEIMFEASVGTLFNPLGLLVYNTLKLKLFFEAACLS